MKMKLTWSLMYHLVKGVGSPVMINLTFSDSPSVTVTGGMSDKKAGLANGRFLVTPIDAEQSVYKVVASQKQKLKIKIICNIVMKGVETLIC